MRPYKEIVLLFFLCFCGITVNAQTLDIEVDLEDVFRHIPLSGAKVSVLTLDSVVVVDSARSVTFNNREGKLIKEIYIAPVKNEGKDYLLRATRTGYEDVWQRVSLLNPKDGSVTVPTIKMRKEQGIKLNTAVVKATRIKMFYKGDTLVYDAAAFKLPDGSMLDALIKQLTGVTMSDNGEIFVNGRRVDELLLSSRSFMGGNKKILMQNLPYYTVKNIKVYDKQSAKSEALGYDVDPRSYVMDVNLKEEYNRGYIANVEGGAGTEDRWMARGFLLGFTDYWRYSLMGNINNVNESRHIGQQGHWSPSTMPKSLLTTRSIATDIDYQSRNKKVKNNFNADYTSTNLDMEMRQEREQFLEDSRPKSSTRSSESSSNWHLKLSNNLEISKPFYFNAISHFDYEKRDGYSNSLFDQRSDSLIASMRTDGMSQGREWSICQELAGAFNIDKASKQYLTYYFFFKYRDNQSWLSSRYNTWQAATQSSTVSHNASDVYNRASNFFTFVTYEHELFNKVTFGIRNTLSYADIRAHDYLYHPDTLLLASQLDMLTSITDASNSYDSHACNLRNAVSVDLSKQGSYKIGDSPINITYNRWSVGFDMPIEHKSLDYQRGIIDTLAHSTNLFISPKASYRHMSSDGKHDFRISTRHDRSPVELIDQIAYRDDSQPLVVKLGNPDLKGNVTTYTNIDYTEKWGKKETQWHVGAAFNYIHRNIAQSLSYNSKTGVYTYKPMNVNGAYNATAKFDFSRSIDEKSYWTWQTNTDVNYNHSVDYSMLEGETESYKNSVNTTILHENASIQFRKGMLSVRATGDLRWRNSKGKMRDFETLNVTDFNYGLSASYTIPVLKTTISTDGNIYSRRGYGSSSLNTDDFVLNASLSQPFLKGKLIARIEAFDLLHQISSTQYEVNAQGRTETWYRSLPNYVMLHLVYHWNKNPKKK